MNQTKPLSADVVYTKWAADLIWHCWSCNGKLTTGPPTSLSSGRRASAWAGALLGFVGQRWRLPTRPVRQRALWEAPSPRQPAQGGSADSAELAVRAPLQRLPVRAGETQSVESDQPLCAAGEEEIFIYLFLFFPEARCTENDTCGSHCFCFLVFFWSSHSSSFLVSFGILVLWFA